MSVPPSPSRGQKQPRPQPSAAKARRIPWVGITLALTAASMVSATAGALLAVSLSSTPLLQSQLNDQEASIFNQNGDGSIASGLNMALPSLNRPVNILLLGTKVLTSDLPELQDAADKLGYHAMVNSFEGLSDTMLLLRFDPAEHKLTLLSIPRDTRTEVPGVGIVKINEANLVGGPALAAQATSELLNGVAIDRYVRVNVQAIEKLIDALGGVEVYVPQDMRYQDDSQHLYINLKQGKQHLDGNKAMQFLRFRYDEKGDIGRVQRQQMLMRAVLEQSLTPKTLGRLPKILSVVRSHLDTNLSVEELFALVNFASKSERSDVQMVMLPGNFSDPAAYNASYWLPNYDEIDQIAANYFDMPISQRNDLWDVDYGLYDDLPSRGDRDGADRIGVWERDLEDDVNGIDLGARRRELLRISIQDSTGRPSATDSLMDQLYDNGFSNLFVQSDWSEPLTETRIIAQKGDLAGARSIQEALGLGEVRVDSIGDIESDITIQLGRDWLQQSRQDRPSPSLR